MRSTRRHLAAAAVLALAGAATLPVLAASGRATTLHVEVREGKGEPKMRAEMPLSVAGAMASAIDPDALQNAHHMEAFSEHGFDLKKFWNTVRESDIKEFFTLEAEDASIRGWREDGMLRLSIKTVEGLGHHAHRSHHDHDADDDEGEDDDDGDSDGPQTIEVRIPERIMELLFQDSGRIEPEQFVDALERLGPMTLVEISGDENVRIWID